MTQKPFSNISIHELEKRGNCSSLQIFNKSISFKENNKQLLSSFSYTRTFSNLTKYIALQIKPSLNISHITAKFEHSVISNDLIDGTLKKIDNLTNNEIYLFFIKVANCTAIQTSLSIYNYEREEDELTPIDNDGTIRDPYTNETFPLDYIDINFYEYNEKNNSYSAYIQKNSKRLERLMDNYYIIPNIPLDIFSNTSYVAISFRRNYDNYNINNIGFKFDILGSMLQLFNNTPNNMTNLKENVDYFFYTKTQRFNNIIFTLTIKNNSNMTKSPFPNIYCQQLQKIEFYKDKKGYNQPISGIINENQLIISISNYILEEFIYYINFKIRPLYNIDYMIARIDVFDCSIDLDNYKYSKDIYSLKSHFKYYIKMNAWPNYITKLNLKIYNVTNIPFSSMIIHDCDYSSYTNCEDNSKKIEFKVKNNIYETTIERKNSLKKRRYLLLEIMPELDIKYMIAETEINEYFQINNGTLAVIIIEIIILIFFIIYIVNHFKKCIKPRSKDLSLEDLDPNNEKKLMSQN